MNRTKIAAILCAGILSACNGSPNADELPAPEATPIPAPAETVNDTCEAMAELSTLDQRRPVPLQPMMAWHQKQNMMEHLVAIQRITGGLSLEDWDEVESAASLIGTSPQMERMCQHMGAGAEGFTDLALDFHRRADAITLAARTHDTAAVLRATNLTLQACTSCHASFRQEVVDAETWQERTGESHSPQPH